MDDLEERNLTVGTYDELRIACAVAEAGDRIWMLAGPYVAFDSLYIPTGVTVSGEKPNPDLLRCRVLGHRWRDVPLDGAARRRRCARHGCEWELTEFKGSG